MIRPGKSSLNELALDLIPGDYGRAICNGRFQTGTQIRVLCAGHFECDAAYRTHRRIDQFMGENQMIYTRSTGCGDEKQEDNHMISTKDLSYFPNAERLKNFCKGLAALDIIMVERSEPSATIHTTPHGEKARGILCHRW